MIRNNKPNFAKAANLETRDNLIIGYALLVFFVLCFMPEISYAVGEHSLENQLITSKKLLHGDVKQIFLGASVIFATGIMIYTGAVMRGIAMIATLVAISFALKWIEGGMAIGLAVQS